MIRLIIALVLVATLAPPAIGGTSLAERLKTLSSSPYVKLLQPGKSGSGSDIPALIISDFSTSPQRKARIFLCAGQHGNEQNPVDAVLSLCDEMASPSNTDLLRRCILIVVPVVNVDGYASSSRLNATGIDLNRDWLALQAPETQYVTDLVKTWSPHVLMDVHEWTEQTSLPANSIEIAHCVSREQTRATTALAEHIGARSGMTLITCSTSASKDLFHRRWCLRGYAAYLLETAQDMNPETKARVYRSAILAALDAVSEDDDLAAALSPAAKSFDLRSAMATIKNTPSVAITTAVSPGMMFAILLMGAASFVAWILRPSVRHQDREAHRRHARHEITEHTARHPMLQHPIPPPITTAGSTRPLLPEERRSHR